MTNNRYGNKNCWELNELCSTFCFDFFCGPQANWQS